MKLSLNWIFDHIAASWTDYDIPQLMQRFNLTVCEVDRYTLIKPEVNHLTAGTVTQVNDQQCALFSAELKKEIMLAVRPDVPVTIGQQFLLAQGAKGWRWANLTDFGSSKEGMVPPVHIPDHEITGHWKRHIVQDWILDLDNKSITHRPDLWGHRGFAREFAAMLNLQLKPLNEFLADIPVINNPSAPESKKAGVAVAIKDPARCHRLSALSLPRYTPTASLIPIVYRLALVDSRPINALVDATNYVMFDISQPLHAFNAQAVENHTLIARCARPGEKLTLLDNQEIELNAQDLVIADADTALSLTGIMGGSTSGITADTQQVILEAGNFDATTIRTTALRHKLRTESSSRFEKSLNPNQTTEALMRCIKLLDEAGIVFERAQTIVSCGTQAQSTVLWIAHATIEERIGVTIESAQVIKILTALGFTVVAAARDGFTGYDITVPVFRATKDILRPDDIIEEVARFYGFENIPQKLPALERKPADLSYLLMVRAFKKYLAFGAQAHEVRNYAMYDEDFLRLLQWQPQQTVVVENPVSSNWHRMVTSLVPHLIKNVVTNKPDADALRFFELARTWHVPSGAIIEKHALSAIFYDSTAVDFYTFNVMFNYLLSIANIKPLWHTVPQNQLSPWYHPYQTAALYDGKRLLGYAGIANPFFLQPVLSGSAFIMELDMDVLMKHDGAEKRFVPLAKFPGTWFDISALIPHALTVEELEKQVAAADKHITTVTLVDFFEKPEWKDVRSVTIRCQAHDAEKTLTKQEIDQITEHARAAVVACGGELR